MRILVAIRQILDPRGFTVNRKAEKIFIQCEEWMINPADLCALEMALRIKDQKGAEVIAAGSGTERVEAALRDAWARGAERAIWLRGEQMEGDDYTLACMLAEAARRLGVDLALCGEAVWDGTGELGPRWAQALGWPQILNVWDVTVNAGQVRAIKAGRAGFEVWEVDGPVVLGVAEGANQPRYPAAGCIINSYRDFQPEVWQMEGAAMVRQERGCVFPPERVRGVRVESVAELAAVLRRSRVI